MHVRLWLIADIQWIMRFSRGVRKIRCFRTSNIGSFKGYRGKRLTYRRTSFRANIAGERLNVIVPEAERVAGEVYTPGAPLSSTWRSSRNG